MFAAIALLTFESFRLALGSLRSNKLRTFLTLLGIIVGVTSVIAVMTIISGLDQTVSNAFSSQGSTVFSVAKRPLVITSRDDFIKFNRRKDVTRDDADASVLTGLLRAVFPVCGGINLEYYFGHVDCPGYGCGTKLPHNITSLLGVMDGAASDLRTGLPWQMVEIHEPVRLMLVCEVAAGTMLRVLERNPMMMQLTANRWVHLAVLDPHSRAVKVFQHGAFRDYTPEASHLPRAASSIDWYRGWRDFLEFAEIGGE